MEHRWGHRIPVAIKVRLQGRPGAIGSGSLRDVSISGAFVRTDLELPLLTRVSIGVGSREIAAWVIRRGDTGLGLEWEELAPQAIGLLLAGSMGPGEIGPQQAPKPLSSLTG